MKYLIILSLLFSTLFATQINLTKKQADDIAKKVWQNEGSGKDKYLIHWNRGEDFASVGIGHFIWFSKGHKERFREVFPMYISFLENKNIKLPYWLNSNTAFPWNSKKEFLRAKRNRTEKYRELFRFIKSSIHHQVDFMAQRLNNALPQMLSTIKNQRKRKIIEYRFKQVLFHRNGRVNPQGVYILLDYTNFKGEGTLKSERYRGQGWGLLQVLNNMNYKEKNKIKAFAISAKQMLSRRIKNSPKARGEERWRRGWNVRLDRYWR